MVSKRGRGARNQAANSKPVEEAPPAAAPEPKVAEAEAAEPTAEDNNGIEQLMEQSDEGAAPESTEETAEGEALPEGESTEAEAAEAEKAEEEKVESGKILIENLPVSYLFDYQDKLKELFSKHGEIVGVKWVVLNVF